MNRFLSKFNCLVISLIVFSSCASDRASHRQSSKHLPHEQRVLPLPVQSSTIEAQPSNELELMSQIDQYIKQNDYSEAEILLERLKIEHPNSAEISVVLNMEGLIALNKKSYSFAKTFFKEALQKTTDPFSRNQIYYNLAYTYYQIGNFDNSAKALVKVRLKTAPVDLYVKAKALYAYILEEKGSLIEAAKSLLELNAPLSESINSKFNHQLSKLLQTINDINTIQLLYDDYPESQLADNLLFFLAKYSKDQNNSSLADHYFRKIINNYPNSLYHSETLSHLRTLVQHSYANKKTIGILLPLTGKYQKFGLKSLRGIELAFQIFNATKPHHEITLAIEDSGDTPEKAIQALNDLYYNHQALAVIGPLLSNGIDQVALRAEELQLPLLSLAQNKGINSDYVFSLSITPKDQSYEIARHAIINLGIKKFAILHPSNAFGKKYSQYFWDAVESLGGEIVGIESYPTRETDFKSVIDKLSGLFYLDARKRELDELKEIREELEITRKTRKNLDFYDLKPIVDFEAVFIPDDAKTVGQVLPTFAYRDIENIKFLGISTWNSPILTKRARNHVEGALFASSYYPNSQTYENTQFLNQFKNTYQKEPSFIEALSYDAASILDQILLLSQSSIQRSDIPEFLSQIRGFPGVTGKITYNGQSFNRKLKILTIKNRKISVLSE